MGSEKLSPCTAQYILTNRFANRRFAPSLVGTALVVVGVVLFVNLGLWQLRRAEQKGQLQAAYEQGQQTTFALTADGTSALDRYQHVRARGRYVDDRQILLDNMPSAQGRPGYRVLTPFELEAGGWLLVDRGWIPMGDRRSDLPLLRVDGDSREVTGRLDELPRPGIRMGEDLPESTSIWPRVMNFPERETIERALGTRIERYILLLDPSQPDGFEREWQMLTRFGPERHVGYAIQWFAFAFVAVVIYLSLSLRREQPTGAAREE
jgi:surfeit locus 1 family protein